MATSTLVNSNKLTGTASLSKRLYWLIAGIAVGLLLVLGLIVRQPVEHNMATVEGYWTPNVEYGPWYLANHGRLFPPTGELPVVSNYTSGLNYGAVDFTHTFVTGTALILSGEKDFERIGQLYVLSPWQGLLAVPLAALALYGFFARSLGVPMSPMGVVILYGLVTFPSYGMVDWAISGGLATPLGWVLFFAIYQAALARSLDRKYSWQWTSLLILFILLVQATYHTFALVLTIVLLSIWVLQKFWRKQYLSNGLIQLVLVAFFSYLIYHAVTYFNDYARLGVAFINDLYGGGGEDRLKYSLTILDLSLWWHAVNYIAMAFPVLYLAFIVIKRYYQSKEEQDIITYQWVWLLSLVPLAFLFFAWKGVFGAYERLLQYGTLLAIASTAFLLVTRPRIVKVLAISMVVCVSVTVVSLQMIGVSSRSYLTNQEVEAIDWIAKDNACNKVIFTDFRIGTTLGYWGCFNVVGPTASTLSTRNRIDELSALFYDGDTRSLERTIDRVTTTHGRRPDLILMSQRFFNPRIGFVLPDTRLQPLTMTQWQTYRKMPGWHIVFENASAMVLARN